MTALEYLRQVSIFAELDDNMLREIQSSITERLYRKGSVIFYEGDPGEGFHYVKSGKVKIVKLSEDGREHIIHILSPGDLFAEVLLFRSGNYPCTSVAVEDSYIGVIKNSDLEKLVLNNNQLALGIIKALSNRLLFAQQKIKNLALDDVLARTADTLLVLAHQHGQQLPDGKVEINMEISRQDLASLVGTTRETVTRTLSMLKKDNLVTFEGKKILINDHEQVARLAGMARCYCGDR